MRDLITLLWYFAIYPILVITGFILLSIFNFIWNPKEYITLVRTYFHLGVFNLNFYEIIIGEIVEPLMS